MPQAVIEKRAIALGYRQGYAKGMQQGLRRGVQKGIKAGRRQGVIDGMRRLVLRQIRLRSGPASATLERRIGRIADARTLERIAGALVRPNGLAQLRRLTAYGSSTPKGKRKTFRLLPEGPAGAPNRRRPRRLAPLRYPD